MRERRSSADRGLRSLLDACKPFSFEPHDIVAYLDARGRYDVDLRPGFPLLVKLFRFTTLRHTRGPTCHDRLELFTPLDGPARMRVGSEAVTLAPGDTLLLEALKVHCVLDYPGLDTRVVVTSFLPEFVYTLGSPSHDYEFLLPFYGTRRRRPIVLRRAAGEASGFLSALGRLVACYFRDEPFREAGCRVSLLEMLYSVLRRSRTAEGFSWEFQRQQERSLRLKGLLEHIERRFGERLPVREAAAMASMSVPEFRRTFRRVSGMKLASSLNRVRLSNAYRLLRETELSIGAVAARTGFADQSYFDRCFKRTFGITPRAFRARHEA